MEVTLNTIALEPNRWTPGKIPYRPLGDLVEPISQAGFDAVEVWQNHAALLDDHELDALKAKGDAAGVSFPVLGMYPSFVLQGSEREAELARFCRMAEIMGVLNARLLKVMPGTGASATMTPEVWVRAVTFVQEALDRTSQAGFPVAFEVHGGTVSDAPKPLTRFIGAVGSDRIKVCFQPMDATSTQDTIDQFDVLAPRVVHLHFQGRTNRDMCLLEEADIDYTLFLAHVFDSGFDGYLSIEFVRDCVVDSPEELDVELVLANAARDHDFIRAQPGFRP